MISMHVQTSMHAHYFLTCLGPYLGQIESEWGDLGIYGMSRICQTYLSRLCDQIIQARMHSRYVLACTGPYLSQIGLDQKDEGICGIKRTY